MSDQQVNPCLAWSLASVAVGHVNGTRPMPKGISTARVNGWDLTVNNSREVIAHDGKDLAPFDVQCVHSELIAMGVFDPGGGLLGGYPEDQFIDDMKAALPADLVAALTGDPA